jgi:hypothetical protein
MYVGKSHGVIRKVGVECYGRAGSVGRSHGTGMGGVPSPRMKCIRDIVRAGVASKRRIGRHETVCGDIYARGMIPK